MSCYHDGEVSSLPFPHVLGNWRANSVKKLPLDSGLQRYGCWCGNKIWLKTWDLGIYGKKERALNLEPGKLDLSPDV